MKKIYPLFAFIAILIGVLVVFSPWNQKSEEPTKPVGKLPAISASDCLRPELQGITYDSSSISSTRNPVLTPEQAGEALMGMWLGGYVAGSACGDRKIGEFKVDSVQVTEQPDVLVLGVTYSVKPTSESKNYWVKGNGKLGSDGWIVGKFVVMEVENKNKGSIYKVTKVTTTP